MMASAALMGRDHMKTSKRAGKALKTPEQQLRRTRRRILTEIEATRDDFRMVDVANHSEADQRHMTRSQEKKTLKRKTHIELLMGRKVLSKDEAAACEWYADRHELGFQTSVKTADWEGTGGGGCAAHTHLARYKAQQEARTDYEFAKAGINPILVRMFERVVIDGRPLGRLGLTFRSAARQLLERIEHMLPNN